MNLKVNNINSIQILSQKIGTYVEIKGYLDKKNQAKIEQFPYKLQIISKNEISLYLDYVISKYGKDFYNLYQDKVVVEKPKKIKQKKKKIKIKQQKIPVKEKFQVKVQERIKLIEKSNINFSKFGWINCVSTIIGISPQKVSAFMKKYMADFYENRCFKRKINKYR